MREGEPEDSDGLPPNFNEAIQELTGIIALNPTSAFAHTHRGIALLESYKFESAISDFQQVIELDPTNVEAYQTLSFAYELNEDFENAILVLEDALEIAPEDPELYYSIGFIYDHLLNEIGIALEYYETYLELAGEDAHPDWSTPSFLE